MVIRRIKAKSSVDDGRPATDAFRLCSNISNFDSAHKLAFGQIAFVTNRHLIDHMLRLSRELDLDFDSLVIWGVLAHQNVAHLFPPGKIPSNYLSNGELTNDEVEVHFRPLKLRDITQITRFPRESVRRKLGKLEERGFVKQQSGQWTIARGGVGTELREFTRETTRRLIATTEELLAALYHADSQSDA